MILLSFRNDNDIFFGSHAAPSRAPSFLHCKPYSSTSIELNWGPVPVGHTNGDITKYVIKIRRDGETAVQRIDSGPAPLWKFLEKLEKNKKYFIKVLAQNIAGDSPETTEFPASTGEDGERS